MNSSLKTSILKDKTRVFRWQDLTLSKVHIAHPPGTDDSQMPVGYPVRCRSFEFICALLCGLKNIVNAMRGGQGRRKTLKDRRDKDEKGHLWPISSQPFRVVSTLTCALRLTVDAKILSSFNFHFCCLKSSHVLSFVSTEEIWNRNLSFIFP